jgi:CheY-like chemotaxis protein
LEIKQDPDLKRIPVLVLTGSSAEDDILTSYDLHANAYITKPSDIGELDQLVRAIEQFWMVAARLPAR